MNDQTRRPRHRPFLPELLNEVLAGRLNPSPILDLSVSLDEVAAGYAAMDQGVFLP